jgi:hypothetical protein
MQAADMRDESDYYNMGDVKLFFQSGGLTSEEQKGHYMPEES